MAPVGHAVVQAGSTGSLVFEDNQRLYYGTGKDGYTHYNSGNHTVGTQTGSSMPRPTNQRNIRL